MKLILAGIMGLRSLNIVQINDISLFLSTFAVVFKCLVYYVWNRALVFCVLLLRSFLNV